MLRFVNRVVHWFYKLLICHYKKNNKTINVKNPEEGNGKPSTRHSKKTGMEKITEVKVGFTSHN